jgi:biopolymer transport protein ExbD
MKIVLRTNKSRIEMIPILDMIFLVLVSFVYATVTMGMNKGINVKLPHASSAEREKDRDIVVSIDAHGRIFLADKETGLGGLRSFLQKYRVSIKDPRVHVNSDRRVPYGSVVKVLDTVKSAGIERVSLDTAPYQDK